MSNLIPLRCTVCGGKITRETLTCRHCGTAFVLSEIEFAKLPSNRTVTSTKFLDEFSVEIEQTKFIEAAAKEMMGPELLDEPGAEFEDGIYLGSNQELDDRVDRKILRYLKETRKARDNAMKAKLEEFRPEYQKLKNSLESNQIDEDTYDDLRKELAVKMSRAAHQIGGMLDCAEAMRGVGRFIEATVNRWSEDHQSLEIPESIKKASQKGFKDIREIKRIVFYLVDGKTYADSFVYRIAGLIDCVAKSGMFSTKPSKRYFSAEVDFKSKKLCSFNWEQSALLNVQEYRTRPLALPKFS